MAHNPLLVPIDFDVADVTSGCPSCPLWHSEIVILDDGSSVFREWHHPGCAVAVLWSEPDAGPEPAATLTV